MDVNLVMFSDSGERKEFPVPPMGLVIGRHEDCSLRIPLAEVSRRHTQVITEGKDVRVKDLGSTNGTFVNNKRITEHKLNPGDHLVVGPVVFTIQIDGEPDEITAVKTKVERKAQGPIPSAADTTSPATDGDIFDDKDVDPIATLEALASEDSRAGLSGLSGSFFLDDKE